MKMRLAAGLRLDTLGELICSVCDWLQGKLRYWHGVLSHTTRPQRRRISSTDQTRHHRI